VVAFIALMALTFCTLRECKMVNLATNFGSICLFMLKEDNLGIALPMAASNALADG
jgi:hypothetical protein